MVTRARVTCGHLGKNGKFLPSLHSTPPSGGHNGGGLLRVIKTYDLLRTCLRLCRLHNLGNADKEREGTGSSKGTQRASHLRAAETESERAIVNWRLGSRFTSLSIAIVIRSQRGR